MLASSLTTALFPFLSRRFAEPDQRGARLTFGRAVVAMAVVFLPLAAIIWLLADPLVVVLFERGSFDLNSTRMTAAALRLFAPSVFALALSEMVACAFFARQDTLTPMRAGFVRVAGNAALCAALAPAMGHRGIALAMTLSLYLKLLVLGFSLRGLFTPAELWGHLQALGRVFLAVGVMVVAVYPFAAVRSTLPILHGHAGATATLAVLGLLCLSAYAGALWVCARREFIVHVALLRRALRRPRHRSAVSEAALAAGEAEPEPEEVRA